MNRRTFLLAAGAAACGAMDRSRPPRPARPAAKPPDEVGPRANVDPSLRASQLHANQIVIHDDILVQADELVEFAETRNQQDQPLERCWGHGERDLVLLRSRLLGGNTERAATDRNEQRASNSASFRRTPDS